MLRVERRGLAVNIDCITRDGSGSLGMWHSHTLRLNRITIGSLGRCSDRPVVGRDLVDALAGGDRCWRTSTCLSRFSFPAVYISGCNVAITPSLKPESCGCATGRSCLPVSTWVWAGAPTNRRWPFTVPLSWTPANTCALRVILWARLQPRLSSALEVSRLNISDWAVTGSLTFLELLRAVPERS